MNPSSNREILQDVYPDAFRHCFGCGKDNPQGLQLACWQDGDDVVSQWHPLSHLEGPSAALHGGITAVLMDEVGSAAAFVEIYRRRGEVVGTAPAPFFVTANLNVDYLRPIPIDAQVTLRARATNRDEVQSRKIWVTCDLIVSEHVAAQGRLLFLITDKDRYDGAEG